MSIKTNALAELEDVNGKNNVIFEVNFDEEHKDHLRITLDGKESIVKYTDLFSMMFILANKEQQAKMTPVREDLGTQFMKTLQIKATKDMKEGEVITVHLPINVPQLIIEQAEAEIAEGKNVVQPEV